jgi:hypothetical protein
VATFTGLGGSFPVDWVATFTGIRMWEAYYYNGRNELGKRIEIPLGSDLNEAKKNGLN